MKLIGYCWEDEQRLLVYEYMARGNLEDQLFSSKHLFTDISSYLFTHSVSDFSCDVSKQDMRVACHGQPE